MFVLELYSLKKIFKIHKSEEKSLGVIPVKTFSSILPICRAFWGDGRVFIIP